MSSHSESNAKKSKAGQDLKNELSEDFDKLKKQKIILDYKSNVNYTHAGCTYKKQYLINFVIETIDNKFILIEPSEKPKESIRFQIL
ncbi:MAG: Unknown protein [uncultured Sulfurovum sp.]|uniref:Uncharacterized protein n=1 Tax=uncultured Sulfurovum sp. TaxID=269237 RepID=A0A6S6UBJ0_9BACT|nr:MAG: Unknown protein [uncultured Sulfurovum sp.]